eukprot:141882_1
MSKPSQPLVSYVLINGFIREVQRQLSDQIIPHSLNTLCWRFYYVSRLLICVTFQDKKLYIADIHSKKDNKTIASASIDNHFGDGFLSGYCLTKEFNSFPPCLSTKINAFTTNVLFKVGGSMRADTCHSIIIDTNTFDTIDWKLPQLTPSLYGNCVSYSAQSNLLVSVGDHNALGLSFNNAKFDDDIVNESEDDDICTDDEWQWRKLKSMNEYRYNPTCITLNGLKSCDKIMVAGGRGNGSINLNTAEIYDIEEDTWSANVKPFKTGRRAAGMYCDNYKEQVYLAGGIDDIGVGTSVEMFDLHKSEWNLINVPNTRLRHKLHPVLWMEGNVLYIASICGRNQLKRYESSNSLECIDLRISKQWNTIIGADLLDKVFGLKNQDPSTENCFLLCN